MKMKSFSVFVAFFVVAFFACSGMVINPGKAIILEDLMMHQSSFSAKEPVVPNASPEAKALLHFIYDVYGKKMLSGQMWTPWGAFDEVEKIKEITGKYPAMRGHDLIHERSNANEINLLIEWWKKGGIPTLMWHWGAPTKGEGYQQSKMKIDIDRCFQEGTNEHRIMWEDFRRVADWLTVLRDANVPVLWRPMHEFEGGWFWYGMGTGEQFIRLWRTMFDYFSKDRGLNNLIWVLCHSDYPNPAFNPGKEYFDIVGADTYKKDRILKDMFNDVVKIHGSDIPIALHECGLLPDPGKSFIDGAAWSWWMVWHTEFVTGHDPQEMKRIYNHDAVITLDKMPDLKSYDPLPVEKSSFWDVQRKGANFFNIVDTKERLQAAKNMGIEFVRLAPNKWSTSCKDFLVGDVDLFTGLCDSDIHRLSVFFDNAYEVGLGVVLTTLSIPGGRWRQQNENVHDKRIWQNVDYHAQTMNFWEKLADAFKDHPAIVGYDIFNEPAPERAARFADWYSQDYFEWYKKIEGTAADLNLFNQNVANAIRKVDQKTPIIIETGFYATPWAIKYLKKINDPNVFYSFHMYEPYSFTSHSNKNRYSYPGLVPIGEIDDRPTVFWDKAQLSIFFEPVRDWMRENHVPSSKIIVGEFGAYRENKGAALYLKDLISIFDQEKWHWAFYAFREDAWHGMNYELGSKPFESKWWNVYQKDGIIPQTDVENPLFDCILESLKK